MTQTHRGKKDTGTFDRLFVVDVSGIHSSFWSGSGAVAGASHSVKNVYVTVSSVCEIKHMVG